MANRLTALEWLLEELKSRENNSWKYPLLSYKELILDAKKMEKKQIKDAYEYGYWRGNNDDDFEPEEYCENPYGK